jgi:hypothetical protein
MAYLILRACERFGIDPREWDGMEGGWKQALLMQNKARCAEEADELLVISGAAALARV